MTPRSAAELTFLIAGTYAVASSVPDAVVTIGAALAHNNPPGELLSWISVAGVATSAVCGAGILLLRRRLAGLLATDFEAGEGNGTLGAQAAAISVVGLYFLASGLAGFVRELVMVKFGRPSMSEPSLERMAGSFANSIVGVGLFFGSHGLVNLWRTIRGKSRDVDA